MKEGEREGDGEDETCEKLRAVDGTIFVYIHTCRGWTHSLVNL